MFRLLDKSQELAGWAPSTKKAISLITSRRHKWLSVVPISTLKCTLPPGSFSITSTCWHISKPTWTSWHYHTLMCLSPWAPILPLISPHNPWMWAFLILSSSVCPGYDLSWSFYLLLALSLSSSLTLPCPSPPLMAVSSLLAKLSILLFFSLFWTFLDSLAALFVIPTTIKLSP